MLHPRKLQIILVAGDLIALLLFIFIGQTDHETLSPGNPLGGILLTGAPFAAAWLVIGFIYGAFRADVLAPRVMLTRTVTAWLIALPIGLALYAFLLGRAVIVLGFMLAAFSFGGLFILGWRMAFVFIARWRGITTAK